MLHEALRIQLRGTKKARLEPCACWIPALKERRASVNEAYTRISEHCEPHRRSHTGNVFQKVFCSRTTETGRTIWVPLERLRDALESTLEQRFRQQRGSSQP